MISNARLPLRLRRIFNNVSGAGVGCEAPTAERESSHDPGAPLDADPGEENEQQQAESAIPALVAAASLAGVAGAARAPPAAPHAPPRNRKKKAAAGSSAWKPQPSMLAQVLGAAQRAGVSTDDSAAAICGTARQPSQPPMRPEPIPPLHPSMRTVMGVGAAVLGDREVRFGAVGSTPLVSEAGSEAGSEGGAGGGGRGSGRGGRR